MIENQDVVTLFSNAQPNLFPTNTAYRFTNRLPHLWQLPEPDTWRVGLSEFSTLNTLDTMPFDLKVNVAIDNDPRFSKPRQVDRFQFFNSGAESSEALKVKDFESRITAMQYYNQYLPPSYKDCETPWKPFVNGLAGVTQQMLGETGFDTYLFFKKFGKEVKLGVKCYDKTLIDSRRFVLSLALQHLLLLDHSTGIQTLKSFDVLKERYVLSKQGKHCDFWYRIIPKEEVVSHWPGFHASVGKDPFLVLESLANKYDFFTFEKTEEEVVKDAKTTTAKLKFGDETTKTTAKSEDEKDEKTTAKSEDDKDEKTTITTVKLKFKAKGDIAMVEFPENFLNLTDKDDLTLKLDVSDPNYEITDKNKTVVKEAYPLDKHLKGSSKSITTSFFLTDGSEIQLTGKTGVKPRSDYQVKNFQLKTYYAKEPVTQYPYDQTFCIPSGNYSMKTFIQALKTNFGTREPIFSFNVIEDETGEKRRKLAGGGGEKRVHSKYKCKLNSVKAGYRITLDSRLQSILGLERRVFRQGDSEVSTRPVLLSSFTYNLMLYCRFIKPNIQGGQLEPVLRTIPFPTQQRKRGEMVAMEFKNIQFHKFHATALEDLTVEIRDDTGDIVRFNDGRTMLKLVFRRTK